MFQVILNKITFCRKFLAHPWKVNFAVFFFLTSDNKFFIRPILSNFEYSVTRWWNFIVIGSVYQLLFVEPSFPWYMHPVVPALPLPMQFCRRRWPSRFIVCLMRDGSWRFVADCQSYSNWCWKSIFLGCFSGPARFFFIRRKCTFHCPMKNRNSYVQGQRPTANSHRADYTWFDTWAVRPFNWKMQIE